MEKILLVEDDIALRKQIRFSLDRQYDVIEAGSRRDALNILKEIDVAVAVLDLGLPPLEHTHDEGLLLADFIISNLPTKIIVLTGQKTQMSVLESIKRGVFDYIMKPVNIGKLKFSIERALLYKQVEGAIKQEGIKKVTVNIKVGDGLQDVREKAEKNLILNILNETKFNVYRTAKILGIKRESLYYFIKKFKLKRPKNV